jgi:hypothetical protein
MKKNLKKKRGTNLLVNISIVFLFFGMGIIIGISFGSPYQRVSAQDLYIKRLERKWRLNKQQTEELRIVYEFWKAETGLLKQKMFKVISEDRNEKMKAAEIRFANRVEVVVGKSIGSIGYH